MRNLFWGLLLVMFGGLLLLNNLGVADFGDIIRDYWPLLLILWGIMILTRKKRGSAQPPAASEGEANPPPAANGQTTSTPVENDLVHDSSVFGDTFLTSTSQNFKGGSLSSIFGDCMLDLSKSVFAEGEHMFRLHCVFGKTTVILPKDAAVAVSAGSTFGSLTVLGQHKGGISTSMETKTTDFDSSPRRLKISISQVFGDIRVS